MITRTVPLACLLAAIAVAALRSDAQLSAQQEDPKPAKAGEGTAGEQTKAAPAKRAKPRGRLPVYYSRVVSQDQREQIYGLQAKFQEEIDKLLLQVRKIEEQRDADVRDVLSTDQQKKVAAFVAEAKAKREARRKSTAADSDAGESNSP